MSGEQKRKRRANQNIFTFLGRLHRMAIALETRKLFTARQFAEQEGISRKTVYRLIDFMRDQCGFKICSGEAGYLLNQSGKLLVLPQKP